ncbi:hypothetical protein [Halobellus ordinarius]|uniref:hypothetical protein n=1 Tax=Halobellus ordinarius TaxID=3075120 RepID=UPI00288077F9|nr:hypothetical protein [Halobellus sp. ZY16]
MTNHSIYEIVENESDIFSREYNGGEREIRLFETLNDGIRVEAVILHPHHRDAEIVGRELVRLRDGRILVFRPSKNTSEPRKAKLFATLWTKTGDLLAGSDPNLVPVDIAVMGKPAIAAYLRVVYGLSRGDIADQMDVKKKTVQQYWNRFIDRA